MGFKNLYKSMAYELAQIGFANATIPLKVLIYRHNFPALAQ
jgi:hypothetical protein